jgi:hypothetical protein
MESGQFLKRTKLPQREAQIREILDEDSRIRHQVYELEKKQVSTYRSSKLPDRKLVRGLKFSLDKYINRLANEAQGILEENYKDAPNQNSGKLIPNYNELVAFLNTYIENGQVEQKSINDVYSKLDELLPNLEAVADVADIEEFPDVDQVNQVYDNIKNKDYKEISYKVPKNLFEIDRNPLGRVLEEFEQIELDLAPDLAGVAIRTKNVFRQHIIDINEILDEIGANPVSAELRKRYNRILSTAEAFLNKFRDRYQDLLNPVQEQEAPPPLEEGLEGQGYRGYGRLGHSEKHITNKIYKTMDDDQLMLTQELKDKNPYYSKGSKLFHLRFNDSNNERYYK